MMMILCNLQSTVGQEAGSVPWVTSPTGHTRPTAQTASTTMMTPGDRSSSSSTSSASPHLSLGSLVCGRHRQSASQGRKPRSRPLSGRFQNEDRMTSSAGSEHAIRQPPATPVRCANSPLLLVAYLAAALMLWLYNYLYHTAAGLELCRLNCNNVALSDNLNGVWRLFYSARGTTALCDSL